MAGVSIPAGRPSAQTKLLLLHLILSLPILTLLYATGGRSAIPPEYMLSSLIFILYEVTSTFSTCLS